MAFTYFESPQQFAVYIEEPVLCDMCHTEKTCLDATLFFGEESIDAICPDCLEGGALKTLGIFTCEGDREDLLRQLELIHPKQEISARISKADALTFDLEKTTPRLASWQDWVWPACDGDYCVFLGYGSKSLYNQLAKDDDGEYLFKDSFYYTVEGDADVDYLWEEVLPARAVRSHAASEKYDTLFYVFKSRHSDRIITVYDSL